MALTITQIKDELELLLQEDNDIVSKEMIDAMKLMQTAINNLSPRLIKARRAGLNVDEQIARLKDIDTRIALFLREYGD